MTRWVALLRGINVGGANRLAMAELRITLGSIGLEHVATYVQSGNVVFESPAGDDAGEHSLARRIGDAIAGRHGISVPVVLRPAHEFRRLATAHPDEPSGLDAKLLHVVFLDRSPGPGRAVSIDPARFVPDRFTVDGREVFVAYPNGSARSKLTIDVFERALGCAATARNLNTVRKLAAMLPAA